jgi:hypothetical protein
MSINDQVADEQREGRGAGRGKILATVLSNKTERCGQGWTR